MAYPFKLPELGYSYDAVEPNIDAKTMEIHHSKHHNTYITNLNKALEAHADLQKKEIEDLLKNVNGLPQDIQTVVRNNGGGHHNHSLFWKWIEPRGAKAPTGKLGDAITKKFGDLEKFKTQFNEAATKRFGSGWAWLVTDGKGEPRGDLVGKPGLTAHGRQDASARSRCLGARLLPEVPEQAS